MCITFSQARLGYIGTGPSVIYDIMNAYFNINLLNFDIVNSYTLVKYYLLTDRHKKNFLHYMIKIKGPDLSL